jgi:hypothetical protein
MRFISALRIFAFCALIATPAFAADETLIQPSVNQAAPDFTVTDTKGFTHMLSSYKGKIVVLEWTNADCPYVKKHYDSGNMQSTQKLAASVGAVWLRVISSAPGKQGHVSIEGANRIAGEHGVVASGTILDETGELGRLYGAKTTPTIAVINQTGILSYLGAIDDKPTSDPADIKDAKNYVKAVLEDLTAYRGLTVPSTTQAYGCGVKY